MTRCGLEAALVAGVSRRQVGCGRRHEYAFPRPVASARWDPEPVGHACRQVRYATGVTLRWRGRAI